MMECGSNSRPHAASKWIARVRARFRAKNGVVRDHHPARFIEFRSGGRVTGYSGCNRFTGTYVQNGDALTMGAACHNVHGLSA
jgi:heat shock protein HslJ